MMGRGARDGAILLSSGMYTSQLNSQRSFSHNAWLARGEGGSPRSVGPPPVVLPQCKCNTTEPNNQQRPTWSDALKETGWMPNTQYEPLASMNYWGTVGDRRRFIVPPPPPLPHRWIFFFFLFFKLCIWRTWPLARWWEWEIKPFRSVVPDARAKWEKVGKSADLMMLKRKSLDVYPGSGEFAWQGTSRAQGLGSTTTDLSRPSITSSGGSIRRPGRRHLTL